MARQIGIATRKELVQALRQRYRSAAYGDKSCILDEFVPTTAVFAHMPTATYHLENKETKTGLNDNRLPVTFLREATRYHCRLCQRERAARSAKSGTSLASDASGKAIVDSGFGHRFFCPQIKRYLYLLENTFFWR